MIKTRLLKSSLTFTVPFPIFKSASFYELSRLNDPCPNKLLRITQDNVPFVTPSNLMFILIQVITIGSERTGPKNRVTISYDVKIPSN